MTQFTYGKSFSTLTGPSTLQSTSVSRTTGYGSGYRWTISIESTSSESTTFWSRIRMRLLVFLLTTLGCRPWLHFTQTLITPTTYGFSNGSSRSQPDSTPEERFKPEPP